MDALHPPTPWLGDARSLVEAYRAGEVSPLEALDASLAAIEASSLNAISFLDVDGARAAARAADTSLPLGGVPVGVKELDSVAGWPATEASVPLRDQRGAHDSVLVERLRAAGAVLVGLTTASEFGGVNFTRTKLHGTTGNPWQADRTPGGSSGGSSAAVSGGLLPLCTAGDGGGSIRIPAAFTGLPGLKCTYGRIPKAPHVPLGSLTAVTGCLSRSVRDIATVLDVANGHHPRDPLSLPRVEGWEAGLGTHDARGLRAAVVLDFGGAVVDDEVAFAVEQAADALIADAGMRRVAVDAPLPAMGTAWALSGAAGILLELGDRYPACADELTPQIRFLLELAGTRYDLAGRVQLERRRVELVEAMADVFEDADVVLTPTCPDVAFPADGWEIPVRIGARTVDTSNHGALTIPANTYGNPSVSIPAGVVRGLPVGLQVMARHHREDLLLDLALLAERARPWPLVAPGSPV